MKENTLVFHSSTLGSSDFDIFLEIQYASCFLFGLANLRQFYKKTFFKILNGFYLI
jgi:hypothetical protein